MRSSTERRLRALRLRLLALLVLVTGVAVWLAVVVAGVRLADAAGAFLLTAGLLIIGLELLVYGVTRAVTRVPAGAVLLLDLSEPVADLPPDDPRARMRRQRPGLRQVVEALATAAADERVAGLWCRIERPADGLADVQELRAAIEAFRAGGKFTVAFSTTFGEAGFGTTPYYLACAFDEVWLQPSGDVGLTGIAAEVTFLRGALDKLGVASRLDARHEYKSARNLFTERRFTPAHREATGRVVGATFAQVVDGIAAGRGLEPQAVRALVDRGPLLAREALDARLVDQLGYRDQALDAARTRAGGQPRLLPVTSYHARTRRRREPRKATAVAFVHGVGAITAGRSRFSPLTGRSMGADTIAAALRAAVRDRRVRAILFRVDSPGGSYVGSDAVWREVVRAREAGKHVVVSMGNVAGSGGYFVAMAADRILAHPATLTGSIGVVGGKAVTAELTERLGLTSDEVHAGAHALMWSRNRDYSASEQERLAAWLDRCYDDFTTKVGQGRGLDADGLDAAARGRVWVGADALERGLVDRLGGYLAALEELRALLELPAGAPLRLVAFPRPRGLLARLTGRGAEPDEEEQAGATPAALAGSLAAPGGALGALAGSLAGTLGTGSLDRTGPLGALARELGTGEGEALLLAPPPWRL